MDSDFSEIEGWLNPLLINAGKALPTNPDGYCPRGSRLGLRFHP